ncbi:recombinase family protein [Actinomadura xylanilytica]|uniref:recombinase family protein n=1 Tax=Actinomadura xylanilytica TaxID=887459 RepID=UPI00255AF342|nr:recombinase family protein [Actinomadura xylanilytica]MDL4771637.1 recombinase family protein [Actinomadura xylanilytica]
MKNREPKRVLGVVRLSNLTDDTSSPERQREKVHYWAKLHDARIVGIAEDLDVSAISASPWERPDLKRWLDKPDEYDVIVAWKLDRLARKTKDFLELLEWADKHSVQIVAVDDGIDLSTDIGRMVATILAVFGEFEGKTMKKRAKDAYEHNIRAGKWRGGFLPYGYRPVKSEDGWVLEPDPETSEILREVVQKIIAGTSANQVIRDLNARNVPTSLDVQRIRKGKEPKGTQWRVANLLKMLRSKTLLGQYEADGSQYSQGKKKVISGDDGLPLQRAEPLISLAEWEDLQTRLDRNSSKQSGNRQDAAPLMRIAFCAVCQRPMYRSGGRNQLYYRCSSVAETSVKCGNRSVGTDYLEGILEESVLDLLGDVEKLEKITIPGEDHTEELEQVKRVMAEARGEKDKGYYDYPGGEDEYEERMAKLAARRNQLASLPNIPTRIEWQKTGEKFRDHWAKLDTDDRRQFLLDASVRIEVLHWPAPISTDASAYPDAPTAKVGGLTYHLAPTTSENKRYALPEPIVTVNLGDLAELYARATGLNVDSPEVQEWAKRKFEGPTEEKRQAVLDGKESIR